MVAFISWGNHPQSNWTQREEFYAYHYTPSQPPIAGDVINPRVEATTLTSLTQYNSYYHFKY